MLHFMIISKLFKLDVNNVLKFNRIKAYSSISGASSLYLEGFQCKSE